MKKMYVVSGQLTCMVMANGALDAIVLALHKFGKDKVLDPHYFYLDEQGYREGKEASYRIPIEKGLKAAGYVFDDPKQG